MLNDRTMLYREYRRDDPDYWTGCSTGGIVSSAHYLATKAGIDMLSMGGNAVDAAVAVSLALGVVEPAGSGLGGNTMAMIHLGKTGRTFVLEGPCRAPVRATPELVAKHPRKSGYKAVAVPTNPAVLGYLSQHYGTMPLTDIFATAIRLAEEGYPVSSLHHNLALEYCKSLRKKNGALFMLDSDKNPPPPGYWFRQPVLARTLKILSKAGFEDFYKGGIGTAILSDMAQNHGFLCDEDFKIIPWPVEKEPLTGQFKNFTVCTMPPPGGGVTLLQMLNIFEELETPDFNPDAPKGALLFAKIIQKARSDRRKFRPRRKGHERKIAPDLADKTYAKTVAESLRTNLPATGETSHFNVMDREGNVVALTQSIERCFGAKVATPGLGFLYNGYMKTFKIENKRHFHYLRPGAVARSNAAPTILLKGGCPRIAIGSTGSERMISGIFQVLVRLQNQTPFEAVKAPRLHCTPEGEVMLEAERFSPEALRRLEKYGFRLSPFDAWSFKVGGLHLAVYDGTSYYGVAEPRRDGAAGGPENQGSIS